jgi:hypothetical protein
MPFSDPKYPVVNPDPEVDDCIKSMRWRDYFLLAGATAGSWGYGYVLGKPVRMPTANTAAAIGFTFATFVVLQDTRGRLMGYNENAKEVQKYGADVVAMPLPVVVSQVDRRFPVATGTRQTKTPLNWKNHM